MPGLGGLLAKLKFRFRAALRGRAGRRSGWDVAAPGRLTSKLHSKARPAAASSLWNAEGATLNRIGRWLIRNHPVADAAFDYLSGKLLGPTGILPRFNTGDRKRDLYLRDAFRAWSMDCDQRGEDTLGHMQEIWVRELGAAGEAFVTWSVRDGALRLNLFEAEQLSGVSGALNAGEQWAGGIVYDAYGRKLRYEVQPSGAAWSLGVSSVAIPADRVAHIYRRERPTQWRGVSSFGAVGGHLWTIGDINAAALATEQMAAYWGIVLERSGDMGLPPVDPEALAAGLESSTADETKKTRPDEIVFEIGSVRQIPSGYQAKVLETSRPHSNYQAFSTALLKAIAASLNVPYSAMSGDSSQSNYSSMRGEEMNTRPRLRRLQRILINRGMLPLTRAWLNWGLLSGELRYPGLGDPETILSALRWQLPGWEWVDPANEAKQEEAQLKSGKKTWIDVAIDGGRDPEDMLEDFDRIRAWNEEHDLNLPLPDLGGSSGRAAPALAPPPESEEENETDETPESGGGAPENESEEEEAAE